MPRTLQEILDQADELSERLANIDPNAPGATVHDGAPLRALARAVQARASAEAAIATAVRAARAEGLPWSAIAVQLGTSGEAARQRYGVPTPSTPAKKKVAKRTTQIVKRPPAKKVAKKASPKKGRPVVAGI